MDAVRTLEGGVPELIRRFGLDPARHEVAVRRLVGFDDPSVEEIRVNEPSRVFLARSAAFANWSMLRIGRLPEDERVLR